MVSNPKPPITFLRKKMKPATQILAATNVIMSSNTSGPTTSDLSILHCHPILAQSHTGHLKHKIKDSFLVATVVSSALHEEPKVIFSVCYIFLNGDKLWKPNSMLFLVLIHGSFFLIHLVLLFWMSLSV